MRPQHSHRIEIPSCKKNFAQARRGIKASPRLAFMELRDSLEIILHPNADRGRRYGVSARMHGYSGRIAR